MLTFLLTRLSRGWQIAVLALLAVMFLPPLTEWHLGAVGYEEVVEIFRYSYQAEKLAFLASVETVMFNLLKRKKRELGGRGQGIIPYQTQAAGVFMGMPEGDTLTELRAQPDTAEATFYLREFQGVWDITWKMLRQAARSKDAMVKAMDFMDKSIRHRILRVMNAQVCSYTGLGEMAILPDADDQTTITVNSLPFIDRGQYLDLMDASDNTTKIAAARQATSLQTQARTVVISGAAPSGTAAGDYFVPAGQIKNGVSYSIYGLPMWLSDANPPAVVGNPGGINRSTAGNEFYQGNVLSNGGVLRAFTEDLVIDAENLMRERGGKQADRWVAGPGIFKRYHGDVVKDRYFAMGTIESPDKGKIGFGREGVDLSNNPEGKGDTNYTISGKPCHIEPYFRANRAIAFCDENFWIAHDGVEMPTPISEVFDGMVDHFTHTGAAKFDIWHYWEAQTISDDPTAGVQVNDLAEG